MSEEEGSYESYDDADSAAEVEDSPAAAIVREK